MLSKEEVLEIMSTRYYRVVYPTEIKRRICAVLGDSNGAEYQSRS